MNSVAFWVCVPVGLAAFGWVVVRARGPEGMPFLVHTGFYLLSTVAGASLIQTAPRMVETLLLGRGLNLRDIPQVEPWLFWGLLYLPLVLAATGLSASGLDRGSGAVEVASPPAAPPSMIGYAVALTGLVVYCAVEMLSHGYSLSSSSLIAVAGRYTSAIALRYDMMASLPSGFFGVVYIGLPALAYVGLYAAVRTGRPGWMVLTALTVVATMWLSLVSAQKAIILVFLTFFGIGMFLLRAVRARFMVIFGGGLLVLLNLMQVFLQGPFGALQSLALVLFRIGPAYPYYIGLFPGNHPFYGVDWQGTLFGREFTGSAPDYNLVVSNALEFSTPVQGLSPIGAVPSAYAEGGVAYALLMGVIVALILVGAGRFGRKALGGPYRFAFYVLLLTVAYYLTQVPLAATIWQSYGIKWGALTLVMLWLLDYGLFRPPPRVAPAMADGSTPQSGASNE